MRGAPLVRVERRGGLATAAVAARRPREAPNAHVTVVGRGDELLAALVERDPEMNAGVSEVAWRGSDVATHLVERRGAGRCGMGSEAQRHGEGRMVHLDDRRLAVEIRARRVAAVEPDVEVLSGVVEQRDEEGAVLRSLGAREIQPAPAGRVREAGTR